MYVLSDSLALEGGRFFKFHREYEEGLFFKGNDVSFVCDAKDATIFNSVEEADNYSEMLEELRYTGYILRYEIAKKLEVDLPIHSRFEILDL